MGSGPRTWRCYHRNSDPPLRRARSRTDPNVQNLDCYLTTDNLLSTGNMHYFLPVNPSRDATTENRITVSPPTPIIVSVCPPGSATHRCMPHSTTPWDVESNIFVSMGPPSLYARMSNFHRTDNSHSVMLLHCRNQLPCAVDFLSCPDKHNSKSQPERR